MMQVELIDKMGSDLTVVNAARVSFANKHEEFEGQKDERLIKYLAKQGHWSPFAHCSMQYHIRAPIFVGRQLVKHQVGLSWNEISRRYVDIEPEFYTVNEWRKKADNKKQGSSDEIVEWLDDGMYGEIPHDLQRQVEHHALYAYNRLLKNGVAPELARIILPQSMMTEWYWSGSLYAFARVCNLRLDETAQKETQEVAKQISALAQKQFPVSWKYLMEGTDGNTRDHN